jgi:hypothetical protein
MGRVIFESVPSSGTMKQRTGPDIPGEARCRFRFMEPDENAFGPDFPDAVRQLRKRALAADGLFQSTPPAMIVGVADAVLPREIFDALPEGGLLSHTWEFTPAACVPFDKDINSDKRARPDRARPSWR